LLDPQPLGEHQRRPALVHLHGVTGDDRTGVGLVEVHVALGVEQRDGRGVDVRIALDRREGDSATHGLEPVRLGHPDGAQVGLHVVGVHAAHDGDVGLHALGFVAAGDKRCGLAVRQQLPEFGVVRVALAVFIGGHIHWLVVLEQDDGVWHGGPPWLRGDRTIAGTVVLGSYPLFGSLAGGAYGTSSYGWTALGLRLPRARVLG